MYLLRYKFVFLILKKMQNSLLIEQAFYNGRGRLRLAWRGIARRPAVKSPTRPVFVYPFFASDMLDEPTRERKPMQGTTGKSAPAGARLGAALALRIIKDRTLGWRLASGRRGATQWGR
jgi:hypothetical protein